MRTPQSLPGRLRSVRHALRLTLAGLGAELDPPRSRSIVCEWEKGRCEPSLATVEQLAKVLGVEPCWLAFGDIHRAQ
jgi:transcriptional regulator with XRE-family HTH domain